MTELAAFQLHEWVIAQETRDIMTNRTGGWQNAQIVAISGDEATVKFSRDGHTEKTKLHGLRRKWNRIERHGMNAT